MRRTTRARTPASPPGQRVADALNPEPAGRCFEELAAGRLRDRAQRSGVEARHHVAASRILLPPRRLALLVDLGHELARGRSDADREDADAEPGRLPRRLDNGSAFGFFAVGEQHDRAGAAWSALASGALQEFDTSVDRLRDRCAANRHVERRQIAPEEVGRGVIGRQRIARPRRQRRPDAVAAERPSSAKLDLRARCAGRGVARAYSSKSTR